MGLYVLDYVGGETLQVPAHVRQGIGIEGFGALVNRFANVLIGCQIQVRFALFEQNINRFPLESQHFWPSAKTNA
jgi:hypothetical protein